MKKEKLKKLIKPIVSECITEILIQEGLVARVLSEAKRSETPAPVKAEKKENNQEKLKEARQRMLESIGKDAYNGIDLFEGTSPIRDSGGHGALQGTDPNDAGVDLSSLPGMSNWSDLIK